LNISKTLKLALLGQEENKNKRKENKRKGICGT
jgi:hypothetical protein